MLMSRWRQHATWTSHSVTRVSPGLIQPFSFLEMDLILGQVGQVGPGALGSLTCGSGQSQHHRDISHRQVGPELLT